MDTATHIREARPEDIAMLIELRERMLVELGSDDPMRLADLASISATWLRAAFAEGRAVGWIAEQQGVVVGGLTMTLSETLPQYRSPRGRIASVFGLYVEPAFRGDGIATSLVHTAIDAARTWDADMVTLRAAAKALPLYERLGFVLTREMRLQFSEYDDIVPPGGCDA